MRKVVACALLAGAIATPGIVVAATTTGRGGSFVVGVIRSSATATRVRQRSVDPRLRPTVGAVRDALTALGVSGLRTFAAGDGEAEFVQLPKPGQHCPIFVLFQITRQPKGALLGSPCGRGMVLRDNVEVDYTPRSLGPTIRGLLAGGNAG